MKVLVFSGVTLLAPFVSLCADGDLPQKITPQTLIHLDIPKTPEYEHRFNFGFLNLGYERIKPDSVYTGFEMKVASLWHTKDKNNVHLDHFVNGELRLGYHHTLSFQDHIIGYIGSGFSMFSVEKQIGKLKNWSYGTLGMKYMHQFGEMFELGLHVKGYLSLSQKRYEMRRVPHLHNKRNLTIVRHENAPPQTIGDPTTEFHNVKNPVKYKTKAVSIHDTRWLCEIGMPFLWHLGDLKNWEIQFEPYYLQIPNVETTHVLGSRLTFGYRF